MKEYTDSLTVAELIQELQQLHQSYALFIPDADTPEEFECKWFWDNRQRAKE